MKKLRAILKIIFATSLLPFASIATVFINSINPGMLYITGIGWFILVYILYVLIQLTRLKNN